ncbi:hypothetical protein [Paenibacillus sp. FSL H3-0333]|uniref:hypothetical protein n=1 Tax=Paenibacillus sp. FSL H3-0333 TaxID=2921373 RepID=UPI0030F6B013
MKIQRLSELCDVSEKAIEFWNLLLFLCPKQEAEVFLQGASIKSRRELEFELINLRYDLLDKNKYNNYEDFLSNYKKSKKKALERLFQQPLNELMLSNFNGDPKQLYLIHKKRPTSWFMECLLYL